MTSGVRFLTAAGLEFAYFSGLARVWARRDGGAGSILRFERVRPAQGGRFQPLRSREITPEFLEKVIRALRRWKFDLVSMDDVCKRARQPRTERSFVALTFDGGYRDVMTHGYPILARHDVPFAIYLPAAFPDGLGEAWWLALQDVIARHGRISLIMDQRDQHFSVEGIAEKYQLYGLLSDWMRSLAPEDRSAAINDLCKRYSVDLVALSRDASMTWNDIEMLATDQRVTIGTATVNYPMLAAMPDDAARREMAMGRAVVQSAVRREVPHFAYPFGDRGSFDARHVAMAEQGGFATAVSAIRGVVKADGRSNLHALPRINWDGRRSSLRVMRAALAGMPLPAD